MTDGDGDVADADLDIGNQLIFEDDAPSIVAGGVKPPVQVDETLLHTVATGDFSGNFTPTGSSDGPVPANAGITYALSTPGGNSGLFELRYR